MDKKKLAIVIGGAFLFLIIVVSSLFLMFSDNSILSLGDDDEESPKEVSKYEGENVQKEIEGQKPLDDKQKEEAQRVAEEAKKQEEAMRAELEKQKDNSATISSSASYTGSTAIDTNYYSASEAKKIQDEIARLEAEAAKSVTPADKQYDKNFTVELPKGNYVHPTYTKYNATPLGKKLAEIMGNDTSKVQNTQYHTLDNKSKPNKEMAKISLKEGYIEVKDYLVSGTPTDDYKMSFLIALNNQSMNYKLDSEIVKTYYKVIQEYRKLDNKTMESVKKDLNTVLTLESDSVTSKDNTYVIYRGIDGSILIGWWK